MQESLLTIVENTAKLLATAQERKEERIGAGDTDKEEKGPGILSKVGSTLGKLNPFGGGGMLDTLGKLVLAVGGIALLKIFGDKAVGPLSASLLRGYQRRVRLVTISQSSIRVRKRSRFWLHLKELKTKVLFCLSMV